MLIWLSTGFSHIVSMEAYDHLLFICCLLFSAEAFAYKRLFITITAFTIGHSLSLALSTFRVLNLSPALVEMCIALTIVVTALSAMRQKYRHPATIYGMVLFFGMIHGLGFSSVLRSMLGKHDSLLMPLLFFNMGIELGQILIVSLILLFSTILITNLKFNFNRIKLYSLWLILLFSTLISVDRFLAYWQQ